MALPRPTTMTETAYEAVALSEEGRFLELWHGAPLEKPPVSFVHGDIMGELAALLTIALPRERWNIRVEHARVRARDGSIFIPDVAVVPAALVARGLAETPDRLEVYAEPVPFVAEVWSPATGRYDLRVKLAAYRERGDAEIWRLHPHERTLTRWLRQEDETYAELIHTGGPVALAALPDATIDLGPLFGG
jgi:Uma2 family endonuclease